MKKCYFLLSVVCLIAAATAPAQQLPIRKITTEVPFDFVVNGAILPAGTYNVSFYATGRSLMIQNRDNPEYVNFLFNTEILLPLGKTHNATKLVFNFSDGQYVLHQIKLENDSHTHDIVHGRDVTELVTN